MKEIEGQRSDRKKNENEKQRENKHSTDVNKYVHTLCKVVDPFLDHRLERGHYSSALMSLADGK